MKEHERLTMVLHADTSLPICVCSAHDRNMCEKHKKANRSREEREF